MTGEVSEFHKQQTYLIYVTVCAHTDILTTAHGSLANGWYKVLLRTHLNRRACMPHSFSLAKIIFLRLGLERFFFILSKEFTSCLIEPCHFLCWLNRIYDRTIFCCDWSHVFSNQFYFTLKNTFLEKLDFWFLIHRNFILYKSLWIKNAHTYYSRHTGVICKENCQVIFLLTKCKMLFIRFSHNCAHISCFYELIKFFFFPLFSWNYLKKTRPYWKYMENQKFPTQSNLKHLRSLSFPFYFFLTNSVPATYFQAPMSRSCRWKCNCNCSCQCDRSCWRRSWRKSKQSWRSSTDCSSRDGKEMEKSGLVRVPALPNL